MLRIALICCLAITWGCAAPAHASRPPSITITIDDTVITRLISLVDSHDDSDSSINAWLDLPGNRELLQVGAAEGDIDRADLYANVKAVIDGAADDRSQPRYSFGRTIMSPLSDYQAMISSLEVHASPWLTDCANRDAQFAPPGLVVKQTVYLELGGDWDAINRDGAIFINMAFFHDYFSPSWAGIDLLISHETFHAVQNKAFGNPEGKKTSDDAFFTALSKIQREGTARYVEVGADSGAYPPGTYGFYFRAVDTESIRDFATLMPQLGDLADSCYPALNNRKYSEEVGQGLSDGGPYYTIGEGIARAIDKYGGRKRLIQTVTRGPLDFFHCYARLCSKHRDLPPIPPPALSRIEALRRRYPDGKLPSARAPVEVGPIGVETVKPIAATPPPSGGSNVLQGRP